MVDETSRLQEAMGRDQGKRQALAQEVENLRAENASTPLSSIMFPLNHLILFAPVHAVLRSSCPMYAGLSENLSAFATVASHAIPTNSMPKSGSTSGLSRDKQSLQLNTLTQVPSAALFTLAMTSPSSPYVFFCSVT